MPLPNRRRSRQPAVATLPRSPRPSSSTAVSTSSNNKRDRRDREVNQNTLPRPSQPPYGAGSTSTARDSSHHTRVSPEAAANQSRTDVYSGDESTPTPSGRQRMSRLWGRVKHGLKGFGERFKNLRRHLLGRHRKVQPDSPYRNEISPDRDEVVVRSGRAPSPRPGANNVVIDPAQSANDPTEQMAARMDPLAATGHSPLLQARTTAQELGEIELAAENITADGAEDPTSDDESTHLPQSFPSPPNSPRPLSPPRPSASSSTPALFRVFSRWPGDLERQADGASPPPRSNTNDSSTPSHASAPCDSTRPVSVVTNRTNSLPPDGLEQPYINGLGAGSSSARLQRYSSVPQLASTTETGSSSTPVATQAPRVSAGSLQNGESHLGGAHRQPIQRDDWASSGLDGSDEHRNSNTALQAAPTITQQNNGINRPAAVQAHHSGLALPNTDNQGPDSSQQAASQEGNSGELNPQQNGAPDS
jgi:hypothetical protein